jgi:hypothetical protein
MARSTVLVFAVVASLWLCCSAAQAAPTSAAKRSSGAWISAAADRLSGRGLDVSCAANAAGWMLDLAEAGLPAAEADEYYGFSMIAEGDMHLSPYVCQGLQLGLSAAARASHSLQVAWAVDVLLHESAHLGRFTTDESVAEACARVGLPNELHRLYGIPLRSAELAQLTSSASVFRQTMDAAYQGGSCPPLPA